MNLTLVPKDFFDDTSGDLNKEDFWMFRKEMC